MLPNIIDAVVKTSTTKFPVVVCGRDNVKTKDRSQNPIFEELSWDIVSSHNRDILSRYTFFLILKIKHIAILNCQCPGNTRITIPTRMSLILDVKTALFGCQYQQTFPCCTIGWDWLVRGAREISLMG